MTVSVIGLKRKPWLKFMGAYIGLVKSGMSNKTNLAARSALVSLLRRGFGHFKQNKERREIIRNQTDECLQKEIQGMNPNLVPMCFDVESRQRRIIHHEKDGATRTIRLDQRFAY